MYEIHIIVNAFVFRLHPARHIYLALQLRRFLGADELLQLLYQFPGFSLGDKTGGLNHIHQKLQLRKLKFPGTHIVAAAGLIFHMYDIIAEIHEPGNIIIDTFSFRADIPPGKALNELLGIEEMLLVGFLPQDFQQVKQLQLLIR